MNICIYFTVFASSGKPISFSFAFHVVFYLICFFFFWVKDCQKSDKKKRRKICWTATTVTSLSRRHMTCHFVSGWCVMMRATRKEIPIMYMIAMLLSAERFLLFLFESRCISGCHLYLRSDHVKAADCTLETHTHKEEESGFLVRLVSRFLDVTNRSSFWKIVVSCCRRSYCCYSENILFSFSLFSYKKDKLFKSQKPGFCEYNAVFSLAHAAVEEQNAHTHMAHLQQHTRSLLIR